MGWIGTVEVNRDAGLKKGETFCHCVSPGSSPMSRFSSTVPIHPVWRYFLLLSSYPFPKLDELGSPEPMCPWSNSTIEVHSLKSTKLEVGIENNKTMYTTMPVACCWALAVIFQKKRPSWLMTVGTTSPVNQNSLIWKRALPTPTYIKDK